MGSGTSGGKTSSLSLAEVEVWVELTSNSPAFFSSLRVRGQHTKTTGRRGRTVGVSKKK